MVDPSNTRHVIGMVRGVASLYERPQLESLLADTINGSSIDRPPTAKLYSYTVLHYCSGQLEELHIFSNIHPLLRESTN